jgi:FMN-dependent NADH-azoreductase
MKNILHIDCSPRPESHSRQLSGAIVKKILEVAPGASISRRDFAAVPLPHAAPDYATTLSSPATLAAPLKGSLDLSEMLIQEVEAADVIVIGTPMHNLTVPSVLKAWIDQILRAGRTFKSTPAGKVGMLRDRPVFIGIASGGVDGRFPVRHLLCRDGSSCALGRVVVRRSWTNTPAAQRARGRGDDCLELHDLAQYCVPRGRSVSRLALRPNGRRPYANDDVSSGGHAESSMHFCHPPHCQTLSLRPIPA